ncbi:MAG: DegT/DnrJ/EryC1/StrS family aminotransferase [archaeon]
MFIPHSKPFVDNEDIKTVANQVKSGLHAVQDKTKEFENKLANLVEKKYAKATNSGTNALHLALLSLDIKENDEVIFPSYNCQSIYNAVNYVKAKPILADTDKNSPNISETTIKPLITSNTKAIIIPHMLGVPANIDEIIKLADEHNIPVIEDCAQSLGAYYNSKQTGSYGIISIFSFFATKVISTGYGGMILTDSEEINSKIHDLTQYDERSELKPAYNYSLTDIQAVLGISQLNKLDFLLNRRKEIAKKYVQAFKDKVSFLNYKQGFPFRFLLIFNNQKERDKAKEELNSKDIRCRTPFIKPLHHYEEFKNIKNNFPNSEALFNNALSIPIYPALTDDEVDFIIKSVKEVLE